VFIKPSTATSRGYWAGLISPDAELDPEHVGSSPRSTARGDGTG